MRPPLMKRRVAPTLDLDFTKGVMPSGLTFTRGSAATYVGPDGLLRWAPMNLVPNSEMAGFIAGTPGSTPNAAFSGSANGIARTIISAGGGKVVVRYFGTANATGQIGLDPTTSVMVPAAVGQQFTGGVLVSLVGGSTNGRPIYARLIERSSVGGVLVSSDVALTSGTYVTVTRTAANASIAYMQLAVRIDYVSGDEIDATFEVSGAQFNYGPTVQPYSPTTGTAYHGPRLEYDPVTLAPIGLLVEESRTNLNTNSRNHLQNTGATLLKNAPDSFGAANSAYTVSEDTSTGGHFVVGQTISFTSGSTYTISAEVWPDTATRVQLASPASPFAGQSVFANFSLVDEGSVLLAGAGLIAPPTIRRGGNGCYVISVTGTCNTTTTGTAAVVVFISSDTQARIPGYTGSGTLRFKLGQIQCEVGPHASSIIPTYGVAATRGNDLATAPGGTWLKQKQGTLAVEGDFRSQNFSTWVHTLAMLDDGTSSNRIAIRKGTAGGIDPLSYVGGIFRSLPFNGISMAYPTLGALIKMAISYGGGTYRLARDGVAATNETTGQETPAVTTLGIGCQSFGNGQTNGHVRRVRYWPTLLPSPMLASITK